MNFYKRHIGDYIKDTSHLSLLEHGVYGRLLDVYYTRETGIPDDQAARLVGAKSKEERAVLARVLTEFFTLVDGAWCHARCDAEIANANQKAERNREVGKKGGRPKAVGSKQKPTDNPDGFQSEPKNNPIQTPDSRLQSKSGFAAPDPDPRTQIFSLGKSLLGVNSGGLISKAIARTSEQKVAAVLGEMAVRPMADPRSYFAAATTPERPEQRGFVA